MQCLELRLLSRERGEPRRVSLGGRRGLLNIADSQQVSMLVAINHA